MGYFFLDLYKILWFNIFNHTILWLNYIKRGKGGGNMDYCEGVVDWFECLRCERLCSDDCPIQRGDIEELLRLMNVAEARRASILPGGFGNSF